MVPHERYMDYAIELAYRGGKNTKSNPMVGSVLVFNDDIIGEGYHTKFGENHAERNAINAALKNHPQLVSLSTLYITLEPCSRHGKTPPCLDYIVSNKIKKVVIATTDPNPNEKGRSVEILKSNEIEVILGIREKEAKILLGKFMANLKNRPYIILKWAQSYDGYMGHEKKQIWLTNQYSKILVHKWRANVDGIMVGTNTAIVDNPRLTTREYPGENPKRVILDINGRIPIENELFNDGIPTIVIGKNHHNLSKKNLVFTEINQFDLSKCFDILFQHDIYNLLIEGGSKLLKSVIKEDLWDEARIFRTKQKWGEGQRAPNVEGSLIETLNLNGDKMVRIMANPS